jgi:hypothetical protein
MPDYAPAFIHDPLVGYLVAAIVGSALVIGIAWIVGKLLATRSGDPAPPTPPSASA